jgi:hypothetical protein
MFIRPRRLNREQFAVRMPRSGGLKKVKELRHEAKMTPAQGEEATGILKPEISKLQFCV